MSLVGWVLVALILGVVGFVGLRVFLGDPATPDPEIGPVEPTDGTDPDGAEDPDGTEPDRADPSDSADPSDGTAPSDNSVGAPDDNEPVAPVDPSLPVPYGRDEPGIAAVGVEVSEGQGLVVLEPDGTETPMRVEIGDSELELNTERVGIALDPGVHHVTFMRGDHTDFVWIAVSPGRTRYVPPLP